MSSVVQRITADKRQNFILLKLLSEASFIYKTLSESRKNLNEV